ncbi:MAG: hypothetical protein ACFB2X_14880 [Rivularia sp. (in: cyanobacteria)]|mgnify:CR=1 FL=1
MLLTSVFLGYLMWLAITYPFWIASNLTKIWFMRRLLGASKLLLIKANAVALPLALLATFMTIYVFVFAIGLDVLQNASHSRITILGSVFIFFMVLMLIEWLVLRRQLTFSGFWVAGSLITNLGAWIALATSFLRNGILFILLSIVLGIAVGAINGILITRFGKSKS